MKNIKGQNRNKKWIVLMIDTFSRYLWAYPTATKSEKDVKQALESMIDQATKDAGQNIVRMDSDRESAIRGHLIQGVLTSRGITSHFSPVGDHKSLAFIDRAVRTLRMLVERYLEAHDTHTWVDALPDLIYNYNHSFHQTLDTSPAQQLVKKKYLPSAKRKREASEARANGEWWMKRRFKVGDKVRVLLDQKTFAKGTKPKFSQLVYSIEQAMGSLYIVNNRLYRNYELVPAEEVQVRPKREDQEEKKEMPTIKQSSFRQETPEKRPRRDVRLPSRFLD